VTVGELDALPDPLAREALARCCGARRWIDAMLVARPFGNRVTLFDAAGRADAALERDDWLEAFAHHPRIGDLEALRSRFAGTAAWAGAEQGGAATASEETLAALAEGNREYERRFGYIFIVCATGKTAGGMLAALRERLGHDPTAELAIAAGEQAKITRLRLEKLLGPGPPSGPPSPGRRT
jgi:2-oxo-4-hydroxy-4-carboxy-5-ureidoimidazoline decarboxylase